MSAGGSRVREAGHRLRHADQAVGFEHMLEPATIGGSPMWLPSSIAETIGGYATVGLVWQGQEGVSCHLLFDVVFVLLCSCVLYLCWYILICAVVKKCALHMVTIA